ncbi:hypothetical protein [Heyndrickxia sp. FSL W8-0423]|uniref:hypothetical protein n=1 Tax=Heyndrickxia sp. FSL W8-0423 TaxID=2921601 RepID=UPI0030F5F970
MDLHWAVVLFWVLSGAYLFLFLGGLLARSWRALVVSGIAVILPSLYFFGAENWLRLAILLPFLSFIFAYLVRKNRSV